MKYLIDTNICIYLLKKRDEVLRKKFNSFSTEDFSVSVISVAELEFGISNSEQQESNRVTILKFLSQFTLLTFNEEDARAYGYIQSKLRQAGTPIGEFDTLIAAQAINRNLILLTNDNHFSRIPNVRIENWIKKK